MQTLGFTMILTSVAVALLAARVVRADAEHIVFKFDPITLSGNGFVCSEGGLTQMTCHDGSNWYGGCAYAGDAITPFQWCCIASGSSCWRYGWKDNVCNGDGKLVCNGATSTWCCDSQYEDCDKTTGLCLSRLSVFPNPLNKYKGPGAENASTLTAFTSTYTEEISYSTRPATTSSIAIVTTTIIPTGINIQSTSSATSSPTDAASSSSSSGMSTGAKAGIAIGCVLGAILVAVGIWFVLRRRKQKMGVAVAAVSAVGPGNPPPAYAEYKSELAGSEVAQLGAYDQVPLVEAPYGNIRAELQSPSQAPRYELDGHVTAQEEWRR